MRLLKSGVSGDDVKKWQSFLFGQGYKDVEVDGKFGHDTTVATKAFQLKNKLAADGKVGNQTYAAALKLGLAIIENHGSYPPLPKFRSPDSEARERMLGKFGYARNSDGTIRILDEWAAKNIVKVHIPQLARIENAPKDCTILFHKNGVKQLQALFAAWEAAGLLKYIKTWAGTFSPRMVRGSKTNLSNHAYASAFDINAAWNGLGVNPPLADKTSTVVPLVTIANAHGFFWGGHYQNRKDGMHFELAVLNMFPAADFDLQTTIDEVQEADKISLDIPTTSVSVDELPIENPPISDNSQQDAVRLPDIEPVEVQQVKPEVEPAKEVSGIRASFAAAITFLTTSGAGIFGLFQGLQKEIVYGFFGATAIVGMIFVVNRFWFANKEKEREKELTLDRERRAHELQMLTVKSAADPNLNTVKIMPQPIQNSDPAPFAGFSKTLTLRQRITGRI